ncbi:hypothetical protein VNO78_06417 [Psophocarpus tetragonolobus]|uniref:Uncharacterized protein n=1 Tax=Psophocarpus tetragonolobus TaxID=3891 RepID=A0AAN9XRK0_PSOTE
MRCVAIPNKHLGGTKKKKKKKKKLGEKQGTQEKRKRRQNLEFENQWIYSTLQCINSLLSHSHFNQVIGTF